MLNQIQVQYFWQWYVLLYRTRRHKMFCPIFDEIQVDQWVRCQPDLSTGKFIQTIHLEVLTLLLRTVLRSIISLCPTNSLIKNFTSSTSSCLKLQFIQEMQAKSLLLPLFINVQNELVPWQPPKVGMVCTDERTEVVISKIKSFFTFTL